MVRTPDWPDYTDTARSAGNAQLKARLELRLCNVEQWLSLADRRIPCDIGPYQVRDSANHVISITPFLTQCQGLTIVGGDWIPIRDTGIALLEQMVHTPGIYLEKSKNLRQDAGRLVANIESVSEYAGDVILVGGDANYYHWVIDYLPRLLLARKHVDIRKFRIVVNKPLLPFQRESLGLLGLHDQHLLQVGEHEAIRARNTLVPSLLAATTVAHPVVPRLLQEAYPRRHISPCKRVYLSRQDARTRKLTNEPELISLLERHGFEQYTPATLGFQQQIDLCYGAAALVAVHGAAMANIAFCPANTKVFEVFTPHHKATFIYMLSRVCKLEHRFLPARNVTFGKDGNALYGNWEVELDAMESVLSAALD